MAKCPSPPQAAAGWWMYSNDLSLPGGLCALPASPSPPSAGTSHSHPAWHCPAAGAGYPGLGKAKGAERHRGEEGGWSEGGQRWGGGGLSKDRQERGGEERRRNEKRLGIWGAGDNYGSDTKEEKCTQYREEGVKNERWLAQMMTNCLCTRGQRTDKHYTQMVHVHGNERTRKHVISHELMQSNWWWLVGPEMDVIIRTEVHRMSESHSRLHTTMTLGDTVDNGRQRNERRMRWRCQIFCYSDIHCQLKGFNTPHYILAFLIQSQTMHSL